MSGMDEDTHESLAQIGLGMLPGKFIDSIREIAES